MWYTSSGYEQENKKGGINSKCPNFFHPYNHRRRGRDRSFRQYQKFSFFMANLIAQDYSIFQANKSKFVFLSGTRTTKVE